jgi:hypothetical protein
MHHDRITDHDLIYTHLPLHAVPVVPPSTAADLNEYNTSAQAWRAHTATENFTAAFQEIETRFAHDNEKRAEEIENFLI